MSFLIHTAFANVASATNNATATAATTAPPTTLSTAFMLLGFLVICYFLIWRPQAKRVKEQRNLLASLAVNDQVTTTGGIVGTVSKINDNFVQLTVADGVLITLQKAAVTSILPQGTSLSG